MFRELRIITAGRLRYTTHSNKVTERAMKTRAAVAFEAKKPLEIVERSEEHTSELQSLMRISYAVFCLKKKKNNTKKYTDRITTEQIYQQINTLYTAYITS